jgi:GNAT superfamily N-acetyltransferase
MHITTFDAEHIPAATEMFIASLTALRRDAPALSARMADPAVMAEKLAGIEGFAAVEDGRLIGYLLSWYPIERFRGAARAGAFVPEWAHGAVGPNRAAIYRALYRVASAAWADAACDVHAISVLAHDREALDAWFWNGFGLTVVDGVRPMQPIGGRAPAGYAVRPADARDIPALVALDREHWLHYQGPPVFMAPHASREADEWTGFLDRPGNTVWLAEDADGPFGFLRFDREFDGADILVTETGVFISGAYVRPSHRGRGAATAILDAALRHYASRGFTCCTLDFESFNPEAASFWVRYFTPVSYGLLRVPEWRGKKQGDKEIKETRDQGAAIRE